MYIEHFAMYVNDLDGAKKFFEKYFSAKSNDLYHNNKTGFSSYFLSFEDGARLEIMNKTGIDKSDDFESRLGYIHLAFRLGSKEKVDTLTRCLSDDGYEVVSGPRTTGDAYYESCIRAFEGNLIELTV